MKNILMLFLALIILAAATGACLATENSICWTEDELAFMGEHPVIYLGADPRFVPFEFIDEDGEYKGIAADYLALITKKIGLRFEVCGDLTWPEAYDLAVAGGLDALPAIGKTTEREEHFLFSDPYYHFKRVIATRDTDADISGMDNLAGSTVAVQRNSSHHSYLLSYRHINLSLYDSVEAALIAVATGAEKAFVGNLATTNYLIRSNGLTNLRFVAFEAEKQQALHFAVRKDWPELVSIINKTIAVITEEERTNINNKWINLDTRLDYGPVIRLVGIVAGFFAAAMAVSFFWIGRLRKEIDQRKLIQVKLEKANCEADEANSKLQKANEELEKISKLDGLTGIPNRRYFDNHLQMLWNLNMRGKFPIALIMIDIDHFKTFNDTYGHLAGDQCLKSVAGAIQDTLKRSGDFAARYGGEEFAVLLPNGTADAAALLAEKIRERIEGLVIKYEGSGMMVTVSLGVAEMVAAEGMDPHSLISAADCALYRAKKDGRNRVARAAFPNAEQSNP